MNNDIYDPQPLWQGASIKPTSECGCCDKNTPEPVSKPAQPLNDPVEHPQHYTSHPSGIEVIELTRHMNFNLGNVVKYVLRADHTETPILSLRKAAWYLKDEIDRREREITKEENS